MYFVAISSLQKTTKPMIENDIVCVLKNSQPAFYTVTPEQMDYFLKMEKIAKLKKQDDDLDFNF